jgi:four helix bundle protein
MMDEKLLNRNKNINRGFRNLDIWKISIKLYKLVYEILSKNTKIFFKSKAQILDSALSISSNIAEGYSRRTIKENLRFYEIALSSAAENYSQMFALQNAGELEKDDFENYDSYLYQLENKIIQMNKKLISKLKSNEDWKSDYE